ncbi:MAG: FAD-binding oxidoreductase [Proteobacteria bacterium]|nr:FAD-binding oxidoreductase [Pseudomonadota bacterium]
MRAKTNVLIVGGGEDAQRVRRDTVAGTRGPARGGTLVRSATRQRQRCALYWRTEAVFQGLYLASGHYRLGITLATGTARLLAELMCGSELSLPVGDFALPQAA